MRRTPFVRLGSLAGAALAALGAVCVFAVGDATAAGGVRVGPVAYAGEPGAKVAATATTTGRLVPDGAPRRLIALAAPGTAEIAGLRAANAARPATARAAAADARKGRPLTIGFGRELPAADRVHRGTDLAWQPVADGGYAARIDVASGGAAALRVALAVSGADPAVTIRVSGTAPGMPAPRPTTAGEIVQATRAHGVWWSPVVEGETATIEIHAPAGVARDGIVVTLARVSHLALAGADLARLDSKRVAEIGKADFCEIDVACVTPTTAVRSAAASVVQVVFTLDSGFTGICTGTLVNDTAADLAPYVWTADHCIDRQSLAATVNTYWFFDAVACGSQQVPPYVLLGGGATLLGRSQDDDWSLVRLNRMPPAGATYSAWTSDPVPPFATLITLHHAAGDLKKWSQGTAQGLVQHREDTFNGLAVDGSFNAVLWNQGSTEPGSSGAGLFTLYAPGGWYELHGGLMGGNASCTARSEYDLFTRMEVALPLLREYLTPGNASPNGQVAAVEFYAQSLDHYFISTNPVEIAALDTGAIPGWVRTGLRFLAYASPAQAPAGTNPVCRFYLRPGFGDSHFYSGDPAECAATAQRFGAAWIYESPNVFYVQLPDRTSGACPAGTSPVWRFFNATTTNHRYTTQKILRDRMRADPAWIPEGYGPDQVIMCSPTG